jgi:hypothetical protein
MTTAQLVDAQARLNISLKDTVAFFEESGVEEHSIVLLNSFIDKHLTTDFLSLAEGFGKCMAFLNHDELVSKVLKSFLILIDGYVIERKIASKRLKLLKEDKKTDPEVLIRIENLLLDLDQKKAFASVSAMRLRAMASISIDAFRNEKFDYKAQHKINIESHRKTKKERAQELLQQKK